MKDARWRLPSGGRIDRTRPRTFTWNHQSLQGYPGDTLASALLANGIHLVGRSFKYHRPRGILSAGAEEPNALVTLDGGSARQDPNSSATRTMLRDGLQAGSQNCWPSVNFDVSAVSAIFGGLWSAGFYYKTFMWPRSAWSRIYEPLIRRAAGLGRAPEHPDPDTYSARYAHCDVLVVGGGPAGVAAARAASEHGASVILCEQSTELGGMLLDETPESSWLDEAVRTLGSRPNVRILRETVAFGYYADNLLGLLQNVSASEGPRQRLWQTRAREVILATGAIERPLVFPDNDRPGIMLASAARAYLNRYAVRVGESLVVYAIDDSGYQAALDLHRRAGGVSAIVDPRETPPAALSRAARAAGIELLSLHAIVGTRGRRRISGIEVARIDAPGVSPRLMPCDALLMAGGWTPTVHLFSQTRSPLRWSEASRAFIPGEPRQRSWVAGSCRGLVRPEECITDGADVGSRAAAASGCHATARRDSIEKSPAAEAASAISAATWRALDVIARRGKSFVDLQNDVLATDIAQAVLEGFHSIEHVKRYTTTGMATDQGKTSNLNALGLAARSLNTQPRAVGTTTFRPPYIPVTFGALAAEHRGETFDPVRTTPLHGWAERAGAVFEPVGLWQRARYFPHDGETMHEAVARECRATRASAGLFDASTLGKIEVVGPDAAQFLDRLYVNSFSTLLPGRSRYGILLREDGFIFDDGVVGRLAPDRFHVTTTTSGAARVMHHMEDYLQTEFTDLQVWLTSTTEHWAVIAVNGPNARRILEPLVFGVDITAEAFPHMSVREGCIAGVPMRLFRMSFTGELGFEVNVPSQDAAVVWEALEEVARRFEAVTYGTEAMHVMRAEKGYILVGQDTDGTVTPDDAGLSWAIGRSKPDFVGKRSLRREALASSTRPQLVGLLTCDARTTLEEGTQILLQPGLQGFRASSGHVTSSYLSATLDRPIALALLIEGRSRVGQRVWIPQGTEHIEAEVVSPVFLDPRGVRIHV